MNSNRDSQTKAVALFYDGSAAPTLTAKGNNDIAEQIIALAHEHDVPIREEPELVNVLSTLNLGDEIPEELYVAVAEIIAFAYLLKGKVPKKSNH